jgi:hypothetical protein
MSIRAMRSRFVHSDDLGASEHCRCSGAVADVGPRRQRGGPSGFAPCPPNRGKSTLAAAWALARGVVVVGHGIFLGGGGVAGVDVGPALHEQAEERADEGQSRADGHRGVQAV